MIIVLAKCGNGYAGCDSEDVFFYNEGTSEKEINSEIYEWACENAVSFSHVHFGWDGEYTEEEWEDYMENNVEYTWNIATREEFIEWCENWGYEPREEN